MGSSSATVGHRYYLGLEATICLGEVDAVTRLRSENREAWAGEVTTNDAVDIHKPTLFGGDDNQGGLSGIMDVRMGAPDQAASDYMQGVIGQDIPAMRGLLTLIFRGRTEAEAQANQAALISGVFPDFLLRNLNNVEGAWRAWVRSQFYWSAMNPYIRPVAPTVRRILKGWTTAVFHPTAARIGNDMNAAHIIYQCFTDQNWGMKRSTTMIDVPSFTQAADQLVAEGFGLSLKWARQGSIEDFVTEVLRHIDAAIDTDLTTAKYTLKLIRNDYDPESLLTLQPKNIVSLDNFSRALWGETINELVVMYTDPDTEDLVPVVVHDLANQRIQGAVITETVNYPGVRSPGLAYRLGERDLRARSTPLATMELTTDRTTWNVKKGDAIRINWPAEKLVNFVVRVIDIDRGDLENGRIRISAVEDVFALESNSYGVGQNGLWTNPGGTPSNITTVRVTEIPYAAMAWLMRAADIDALSGDESFPVILCEKPSAINQKVNVYESPTTDIDSFELEATGRYTPTALLSALIDRQQTAINYHTVVGGALGFYRGAFALIDNEWIGLSNIDTGTGTIVIERGLFDSIPEQHAANARIWIYSGSEGVNLLESDWVQGETTYFRETASSVSTEIPVSGAPQQAYTHKAVWSKPYPPANVQFDGQYFPASVIAGFTITWAGRDRVSQADTFVDWYEAGVQPEDGVTYSLRVYNASTSALIGSADGLTTTAGNGTYTYAGLTAPSMRIELFAIQDSVSSEQIFSHTAALAP